MLNYQFVDHEINVGRGRPVKFNLWLGDADIEGRNKV